MRVGLCLALLVCAALMSVSDAKEKTKRSALWGVIKSVAKQVVTFVLDAVKKRALGEAPLAHQQRALDDACARLEDIMDITNGGVPFTLVKDIFEEVDGGDDVLDGTEFVPFMESLAVVQSCLSN